MVSSLLASFAVVVEAMVIAKLEAIIMVAIVVARVVFLYILQAKARRSYGAPVKQLHVVLPTENFLPLVS